MKQFILVILVIAALVLGGAAYYYSQKSSIAVLPVIQPTPTVKASRIPVPTVSTNYCLSSQIQARIQEGAAAGNIYGTLTLKNISQSSCEILGGEFINASYAASVKNITISRVGKVQSGNFVLAPNQTLYSQVHYPNGPQCQSVGINPVPVLFTYKISPTATVGFTTQNNGIMPIIQACKSPTDMTIVQIWGLSTKPIVQ